MKKKFLIFGIFLLLLLLSIVFFSDVTVVMAADPTIVSINPTNQTVSVGDTLSVTVLCSPQQSIKAFELKVSFNPSLLQATSVIEGDLFNNFTTFFNAGVIDNTVGTIVNIYDLIVGLGNVTNTGILVFINFTTKYTSGTSTLGLYDVQLTNESDYIDITVLNGTATVTGGDTPSPDTPPDEPPVNPPSSENTPPSPPRLPTGLAFVTQGTTHEYSSAAIDPDGDLVRLRFSWGDGSLSNWTDFVASNTTISVSHTWVNVSSYTIRVIAQDTNGVNSSWSEALNLMVSQNVSGGNPPIGMFNIPENAFSNQSILFDTAGSYDPDGMIVSYQWDFGDGTTAAGENPVHTYRFPGEYTVTLTVIDDAGMEFSISEVVSIAVGGGAPRDNDNSFFQSYSTVIIIPAVAVPLFILFFIFKDNIEQLVIQKLIERSRRRLAQLEEYTVVNINEFFDKQIFNRNEKSSIQIKNSSLGVTNNLIVGNGEETTISRLPDLNIDEIEKFVDHRIHIKSKNETEDDKL